MPTAVCVETFRPLDLDNPKKNDNVSSLLFVGNIVRLKGVETLLLALHRLVKSYELRLTFVGFLPDHSRRWFFGLIDLYHLSDFIDIRGSVEREKVVEAYRRADILVCPSRVEEASPRVVKEAAACGC